MMQSINVAGNEVGQAFSILAGHAVTVSSWAEEIRNFEVWFLISQVEGCRILCKFYRE